MGMALSTLPGVFLGLMALGYTLDLPRLDQWEFIPFLEKAYNGTLSWHDFWAQHNEHRIVFPRLVFLLLAKLTAWNLYYEVAANLLLGLLIFILIAWQAHVGYARCQLPPPFPFLWLLSLCVFSLSQWQNWFLGWQLQIFMSLFFLLSGCALLNTKRGGWGTFSLVLLCGIGATYSFANGMLFWPIAIIFFWANSVWKHRHHVCFIGVALLVMATYFYGYTTPSYHPPLWNALRHPIRLPLYVLCYLGQPVFNFHKLGAACIGLVGVTLWGGGLYRLFRYEGRDTALLRYCLMLGGYSLASALMTAVARVELGTAQAMSSRYITLANPLWCSLFFLLPVLLPESNTLAKMGRYALSGGLAILLLTASLYGAYRWTERYNACQPVRDALLAGERTPLVVRLHPDSDVVYARTPLLRQHGLCLFHTGDIPEE